MSHSRLATANGALLLLTLPFLLRLWVEAVVWRIDRGPQMLGFSLVHGGAGVLTVPLVISWLVTYVYLLFAVIVAVLWIVPALRVRMVGALLVVLGGVGTFVSQALAASMQNDLPLWLLYAEALVLSVLIVLLVVAAVASLRLKVAAPAGEPRRLGALLGDSDANRRTVEDVLQSTSDVLFPAELGEHRVSLSSRDADGDSPLHVLAWRSDVEGVELLVDAGADANAIGDMGETPLHVAIHRRCVPIVVILVRAGARTDIPSEFGATPLDLATAVGGEIAKVVRGPDVR